MKILSLFDGMSVAQQALKDAGIEVTEYYASEIDPYAIAVAQSNFPNTKQLGSVTNIIAHTEPFDLLIGGSPCQDLSIAKKNRKGLSGSRSGLFWEYVRIRNENMPNYFILENVASMQKEAKDIISEALGVQPIMINASLVSAQNRKRLFWVGKLDEFGTYSQVEIVEPKDRNILLKDILEENIDAKYFVNVSEKYGNKGLCELNAKAKAMTASMWKGYGNDGVTTIYHVPHGYIKEKLVEQDKYPTLCGQDPRTKHILYPQIRKLSPIECLRLQSMPDDYFDKAIYKNKSISNTQRYKMCGNAFNKEVIVHILKSL